MEQKTSRSVILNIARQRSIVTSKELRSMGIHPQSVKRMVDSGELVRVAPGRYRLPDPGHEFTEYHGLVLASRIAPKGVICLLSALQFHGIGTQLPRRIWVALPRGSWKPTADYPPMRFVFMSGSAFTAGIEKHTLEGQTVRVYSVAKTVVDSFKFRNTIGMDVALEALTESWRERRLNLNQVAEYARVCHVWSVMRPYLEVISA